MTLQKRLDSLQPYVIGIRFYQSLPVVDAVFKENWIVPNNERLKLIKGDDNPNYYMIVTEQEGVAVDDLLDYVDSVIKMNYEREQKHELLKTKINELKEIFKKNTLAQLTSLTFCFQKADEFETSIHELDEPMISVAHTGDSTTTVLGQPYFEETLPEIHTPHINPENLSEEEREILEEEARAEAFRKRQQQAKQMNGNKPKVELPPKQRPQVSVEPNHAFEQPFTDCKCGEEEACDKCIEHKGF